MLHYKEGLKIYRRYVKRGNKQVGPYWYESIRTSGIVKNVYLGRTKQEALKAKERLYSKCNVTNKLDNKIYPFVLVALIVFGILFFDQIHTPDLSLYAKENVFSKIFKTTGYVTLEEENTALIENQTGSYGLEGDYGISLEHPNSITIYDSDDGTVDANYRCTISNFTQFNDTYVTFSGCVPYVEASGTLSLNNATVRVEPQSTGANAYFEGVLEFSESYWEPDSSGDYWNFNIYGSNGSINNTEFGNDAPRIFYIYGETAGCAQNYPDYAVEFNDVNFTGENQDIQAYVFANARFANVTMNSSNVNNDFIVGDLARVDLIDFTTNSNFKVQPSIAIGAIYDEVIVDSILNETSITKTGMITGNGTGSSWCSMPNQNLSVSCENCWFNRTDFTGGAITNNNITVQNSIFTSFDTGGNAVYNLTAVNLTIWDEKSSGDGLWIHNNGENYFQDSTVHSKVHIVSYLSSRNVFDNCTISTDTSHIYIGYTGSSNNTFYNSTITTGVNSEIRIYTDSHNTFVDTNITPGTSTLLMIHDNGNYTLNLRVPQEEVFTNENLWTEENDATPLLNFTNSVINNTVYYAIDDTTLVNARHNITDSYLYGLAVGAGTVELTNTTIDIGNAHSTGKGIYLSGGNTTFTECNITGGPNTYDGNMYIYGSAHANFFNDNITYLQSIYMYGSSNITLVNSSITDSYDLWFGNGGDTANYPNFWFQAEGCDFNTTRNIFWLAKTGSPTYTFDGFIDGYGSSERTTNFELTTNHNWRMSVNDSYFDGSWFYPISRSNFNVYNSKIGSLQSLISGDTLNFENVTQICGTGGGGNTTSFITASVMSLENYTSDPQYCSSITFEDGVIVNNSLIDTATAQFTDNTGDYTSKFYNTVFTGNFYPSQTSRNYFFNCTIDTTLGGASYDIRLTGNSGGESGTVSTFENCSLTGLYIYFWDDPVINFTNCVFNTTAVGGGNNYTAFWATAGSTVNLTFSKPGSSWVDGSFYGAHTTSGHSIYGYVNLPSVLTDGSAWDSNTITRYFPVYVMLNDNITGVPYANISITNFFGDYEYEGQTDSDGFLEIPINFNKTNSGYISNEDYIIYMSCDEDCWGNNTPKRFHNISFFTGTAPDGIVLQANRKTNSSLVSPANNTITSDNGDNGKSITFYWNSTDLDDDTLVAFEFELSNSSDFSSLEIDNITLVSQEYNFTIDEAGFVLDDGTYYWRARANDSDTWGNWSDENWTIIIDSTLPLADLDYPTNDLWLSNPSITFNYTLVDVNPDTCELWHNMSGDFIFNQSMTSSILTNGSTNNFTSITLSDGFWGWGVFCNDTAGNGNWSNNFSVGLDTGSPTITLTQPTNASVLDASNETTTIDWTYVETNKDACWYEYNSNGTNTTMDCDQLLDVVSDIGLWNNVSVWINDSSGREATDIVFYYINQVPTTPSSFDRPVNNTQKVYNNLSFDWGDSTDADGHTVYYDIELSNDSDFSNLNTLTQNLTTSDYTNLTLEDGWQYWHVRSWDGYNYSNWSDIYYVDVVQARISITAPTSTTTKQPSETQTVTIEQTTRSDWLDHFTFTITGDGQNSDYTPTNDSADNLTSSYSYTYTVPSSMSSGYLVVTTYGWNDTENVSEAVTFVVSRAPGPAISAPRATNFYAHPTYTNGSQTVNIALILDMDVLNKTVTTTMTYPNGSQITLVENNYSDAGSESYDYTYNYSIIPNAVGAYTLSASFSDTNDQSNSSTALFFVSNPSSVDLLTGGGTNIVIKDISSEASIVSGSSISESSFVDGDYNVEVITGVGTVTLSNASVNSTLMSVLNYSDLTESDDKPADSNAIDTFSLSSDLAFYNNGQIVYDYSSKNGSFIHENNLEMYKCSGTGCTWTLLSSTQDIIADTITATFSGFSNFILVEDTTTLTATSASSGNPGGGAALQKASIKIITPAALTANPLKMLLEDTVRIPLRIQNNGNKALSGISLSSISENPLIKLSLDKTSISSIDVGGSEIVMATLTSALKEPGVYTVKILTSSASPAVSDESELIIAVVTIFEEKVQQIITRVVFAKDLFKEHPECLELQELLDKADQAMQDNDYEKARTLTETAILGCQDMITALSFKKEVAGRLPFTKQQMIILIAVGSSVLTVVTLMMISPKRRKKVFEKIRTKSSFKIGFKLPAFKIKQSKEKESKAKDVWKRE